MANETIVPQIASYIPVIWEAALMYVRQNFVMSGLVTTLQGRGMTPRQVTEYVEGSVQSNLGEVQDLTPTLIERDLLAQLVPSETGVQYLITDRRVETDDVAIIADAAEKIGYEIGKSVERNLLGDFANLRGGSVGSAGADLTWKNIFEARARLVTAGVPGPYNVVLHEYQWLELATANNIAATGTRPMLTVLNDIQSRYYVGTMNDMNIYTTGLLVPDGSDDVVGAIFNRSALALDMRRALRIEPERDASLRATELNASMIYAHGIWRPQWGVKLIGDAATPGSNVTVNSQLAVFITVDDASATAGQDLTFTITVVNIGTVVAASIDVVMTIDADFTFLETTQISQGSYLDATSNVWTLGSLAPGEGAVLRVKYDIAGAGDFVATINATTGVTPPMASNVSATQSVTFS